MDPTKFKRAPSPSSSIDQPSTETAAQKKPVQRHVQWADDVVPADTKSSGIRHNAAALQELRVPDDDPSSPSAASRSTPPPVDSRIAVDNTSSTSITGWIASNISNCDLPNSNIRTLLHDLGQVMKSDGKKSGDKTFKIYEGLQQLLNNPSSMSLDDLVELKNLAQKKAKHSKHEHAEMASNAVKIIDQLYAKLSPQGYFQQSITESGPTPKGYAD